MTRGQLDHGLEPTLEAEGFSELARKLAAAKKAGTLPSPEPPRVMPPQLEDRVAALEAFCFGVRRLSGPGVMFVDRAAVERTLKLPPIYAGGNTTAEALLAELQHVLGPVAGDHGDSEGLVDCARRIITERNEARRALQAAEIMHETHEGSLQAKVAMLEASVGLLRADLAQEKAGRESACATVAAMHAAARGEVAAPRVGVVEDVEDLRRDYLAAREARDAEEGRRRELMRALLSLRAGDELTVDATRAEGQDGKVTLCLQSDLAAAREAREAEASKARDLEFRLRRALEIVQLEAKSFEAVGLVTLADAMRRVAQRVRDLVPG